MQMRDNRNVLIVATTAYMIRQFNINNIELLQRLGYKVEVACNFTSGNPLSADVLQTFKDELESRSVLFHDFPFVKSVFDIRNNLNAYNKLRTLMRNKKYAFIHCQTPVAGVVARVAAWKTHTPNIYMAHGFHFYKGASFVNWIFFYPIEKVLSGLTDVLIVINQEDYNISRKKLYPKRLYYLPGVGIETSLYQNKQKINSNISRAQIGIPENVPLLLSVGELSKRKNHEVLIKAIADIPNVHLMIAGTGALEEHLKLIVKCEGVVERVHFLGFRKDIRDIYPLADIYCHPAHQEGLSVAIMEAMASGLPIVCSDIRGNNDLVTNGKGGVLVLQNTPQYYVRAISELIENKSVCYQMTSFNLKRIKLFDSSKVNQEMEKIYRYFDE